MNKHRADYSLVVLGFASIAGAMACLGWADSLGGFRFVGATAAIFLAMLSFIRFAAVRRPPVPVRTVPKPEEPMRESIRAPITHRTTVREDAELVARLAALRLRKQELDAPLAASRQPESGVTVIEGPPLDFEPTQDAPSSAGLRQMDDLRAEIARLRESARMRHTGSVAAARVAPPGFPDDPFARTEFSGLPGEWATDPSDPGDAFPRTEFSGLGGSASERRR